MWLNVRLILALSSDWITNVAYTQLHHLPYSFPGTDTLNHIVPFPELRFPATVVLWVLNLFHYIKNNTGGRLEKKKPTFSVSFSHLELWDVSHTICSMKPGAIRLELWSPKRNKEKNETCSFKSVPMFFLLFI